MPRALVAVAALAVALAIGACASGGRGADAPEEGQPVIAMLEELAAALAPAGDESEASDCDAFAGRLSEWVESEGEEFGTRLAELREDARGLAESDRAAIRERLGRALAVVVEHGAECEHHDAARRAVGDFDAALGAD